MASAICSSEYPSSSIASMNASSSSEISISSSKAVCALFIFSSPLSLEAFLVAYPANLASCASSFLFSRPVSVPPASLLACNLSAAAAAAARAFPELISLSCSSSKASSSLALRF